MSPEGSKGQWIKRGQVVVIHVEGMPPGRARVVIHGATGVYLEDLVWWNGDEYLGEDTATEVFFPWASIQWLSKRDDLDGRKGDA